MKYMWEKVTHYRSKLGMDLHIYIGGNMNMKNIEVLYMFFNVSEITHIGEALGERHECEK